MKEKAERDSVVLIVEGRQSSMEHAGLAVQLILFEKWFVGGSNMAICSECGCEFDVSYARRSIGARYGAGAYNLISPDGDMCERCANSELSCIYGTTEELIELMGDSWYDD